MPGTSSTVRVCCGTAGAVAATWEAFVGVAGAAPGMCRCKRGAGCDVCETWAICTGAGEALAAGWTGTATGLEAAGALVGADEAVGARRKRECGAT